MVSGFVCGVEREGDSFTFNKPLEIVIGQNEQGQPGMGFKPFMPFLEDKIVVEKHNVVFQADIDDRIADVYRQHTSTITVPSQNLIVPG